MMNGKKQTLARQARYVSCLLIPTLLVIGCKQKQGGPPPGMKVPVIVAEVKEERIQEEVNSIGNVAGDENVELRSEVDGRVEKIAFQEGELVEKGTLLVQIDQEKLSASLAEARANLHLAEANKKRSQELLASRTISQREYDQAEAEYLAAVANTNRLEDTLRDARLEAPFTGVVGSRLVSPGQYVQKGQMISSIVALDPVKVEFFLPERYLSTLALGQNIEISVAAYQGEQFEGEIFFISPEVDIATRTVLVKARVANPDMKLRAGMLAEVATILEERSDALIIPESAVLLQKDSAQVFVATTEGSVELRTVELGVQLEGRTEVRKGLEKGELVVAEGTQKIGPGAAISFEDPREGQTKVDESKAS